MKIISVLEAHASPTLHMYEAAVSDTLWPSSVQAITYVIAWPDPACERFIAYAINVDDDVADDARGLFSIAERTDRLPELLLTIAQTIEERGTGVPSGNKPKPGPGNPPWRDRGPPPGPGHPVIGMAMIRRQITKSYEQQLSADDRSRGE
jgi:hypothetical protein